MGTFNKITTILFCLVLSNGCTLFEVQAPVDIDVQVGPNACDFVDAFEASPNPGWSPADYTGCNGYGLNSAGDCLSYCVSTEDCDIDFYCVYEVGECYPRRIAGECTVSEECVSDICMCNVCVDEDALIEFIGNAAIEGIAP